MSKSDISPLFCFDMKQFWKHTIFLSALFGDWSNKLAKLKLFYGTPLEFARYTFELSHVLLTWLVNCQLFNFCLSGKFFIQSNHCLNLIVCTHLIWEYRNGDNSEKNMAVYGVNSDPSTHQLIWTGIEWNPQCSLLPTWTQYNHILRIVASLLQESNRYRSFLQLLIWRIFNYVTFNFSYKTGNKNGSKNSLAVPKHFPREVFETFPVHLISRRFTIL